MQRSLPQLPLQPIDKDEAEESNIVVSLTNQERHNSSLWTQKYNAMIRPNFVHESLEPVLQRYENTDAFRRPRKRYTIVDPLPLLRAEAATLRHDAVLTLTRQNKRKNHLLTIKDEMDAVSAEIRQLQVSRTPFNPTHRLHNSRCEYCWKIGGELACALCNIVAHTSCYIDEWKKSKKKGPVSFEIQGKRTEGHTRWICTFCDQDLQDEYDGKIIQMRHEKLKKKELSCARLIAGYTRMSKEARTFVRKKECAVQIQARIRGKLARKAFNEMQRQRIRPYVVNLIRLRGLGDINTLSASALAGDDESCETRLPNGFLCNPYIVFHIVAEHDDEAQQFCFESEIQKGSNEVMWNEAIFVPGVDGNVTMCFTLLSKNGPNNFFLGQGTVRMSGTEIWRYGANMELAVKPELEVIPRAGHNKLMRIQDIGSFEKDLTLSIHIQHFPDSTSNCGYMQSINTIDSVKGNSRWCVLSDGIFRIYRHYGLTLAFETLKMAHASEVQLLTVTPHHLACHHTAKHSTVVFIQHEQRSYLLRAESNKANMTWTKKLLLAMKHKY
ncbi:hypothetical protein THRCLA_20469 [Thraustotheca clavata]|uniref:PH domain-containing protein n=1 Tax=Thraustotheca clavata TaxID=74557 RepID=A0A1W0A7K7_9STRA|nr:hypothetical protein THRCLA_20469 [Thraustotheca clavata]